MTFAELKALDETYVMHTYGRFPVDIDHGQGATLYSLSGRKYIDFTSGIGVNSLGYGNPKWMAAITEQIGKLGHISNLFYTQPGTLLAQQLCTRSGMDKVFFGNSGAEANEAMIKVARKYSFDKYGKGRSTILTLNRSFHGRTITTLTATGQESYHNYFFPFNEAFRYADPTLESIQAQAGDDVCAVMVELIQGEGGLRPLEVSMVQSLAALCREKDWLLLVDEVQTGIGRTGSASSRMWSPSPRGSPAACPWVVSSPTRSAPGSLPLEPTAPPSEPTPSPLPRAWRCWRPWTSPSWTRSGRRAPTSGRASRPSAARNWGMLWAWASCWALM